MAPPRPFLSSPNTVVFSRESGAASGMAVQSMAGAGAHLLEALGSQEVLRGVSH